MCYKQRRACAVGLALASGWIAAPSAGLAAGKPNIVILFADDLGYGGVGVQGCKDIPTPNVDSVAAAGVRCTNGYVTCPVCAPTRCGLLLGRYQQRFGFEHNPGPPQTAPKNFGVPSESQTLPEALKAAGYHTGMVGKWHLGYEPGRRPPERGFDEFFGFLGGAHTYFPGSGKRAEPIYRGLEPVDEKRYLTDAFGEEAVAFIDRNKDKPFFLYLAFNAVHTPMEANDERLQRFASIANAKRRQHAAMLTAMDEAIGAVLKKLRDEKLEENTLVFFLADNGGPTAANTSKNDPLSGFKGMTLEGGIRIPYMVQWKNHLPAGKTYETPVSSLDIFPTALAAAGAPAAADRKLDGVDLTPFLKGEATGAPHETLYWRFGDQGAIRKGDWKLQWAKRGEPKLFHLSEDVGEKRDLASAEPAKVKELQASYADWEKEMQAPKWRGRGGRAAPAGGRAGRLQRRMRQRAGADAKKPDAN